MSEEGSTTDRTVLVVLLVVVVVALVLLVPVTILGAAVVGTFVLDHGSDANGGSQMAVGFSQSDDAVVVEPYGDGPWDGSSVVVEVDGQRFGTWNQLADTEGPSETIRLTGLEPGDRVVIVDTNANDDGDPSVVGTYEVT